MLFAASYNNSMNTVLLLFISLCLSGNVEFLGKNNNALHPDGLWHRRINYGNVLFKLLSLFVYILFSSILNHIFFLNSRLSAIRVYFSLPIIREKRSFTEFCMTLLSQWKPTLTIFATYFCSLSFLFLLRRLASSPDGSCRLLRIFYLQLCVCNFMYFAKWNSWAGCCPSAAFRINSVGCESFSNISV